LFVRNSKRRNRSKYRHLR